MITVAIKHKTTYQYDRSVVLGPQIVRLRPAPQCRTPITSYSLDVTPKENFVNWQQDVHGNYLARFVFPKSTGPTKCFQVNVDFVAAMIEINPFNFFLEETAEQFPFEYESALKKDLRGYLEVTEHNQPLLSFLETVERTPRRTIDFLVDLNQRVEQRVDYEVRMESGVQSAEETLNLGKGSCRDSAWLLVQVLRHLGLAARFVSGYLIQLKSDMEASNDSTGPKEDFTDLHAWTEVFLPGAGWVGLDPTSGLLAGEGHIPLACTPAPLAAAPISGTVENCKVEFEHHMSIERVHKDPRIPKPHSATWATTENTNR